MPGERARLIAFYLPQYHPIPENDEWWGKGFTEWTNVARAKPLFPGHYQPRLPADLGFYDLRLPEVRQAQAELAREYGIHGFCYYHYWFHGRRLLERPFNEVLASGKPDFPFCLCWANESWTRRWDGLSDVLIDQKYSEEDDLRHIRWLAQAFRDPRYIRIDGKPIFLVYRALSLPDPRATADLWREEARRLGVGELFLCRVEMHFEGMPTDPRACGFDASVEFQPDGYHLGPKQRDRFGWRLAARLGLSNKAYHENYVWDYSYLVECMLRKPEPEYPWLRCMTPSWDNTARRQTNAAVFKNSSPECYEKWLRAVVERAWEKDSQPPVVFVNAWNEWAEGNHLEPDQRFGRGYLEATRRVVAG